ncbi:pyridoxal 5'-phosphate synthase glutaminase subunit PdxT [Pseudarthrobacter sp. H3Y2-7]|jgi:5'-phosphate synthase pdxT subunit|uniref:pyridoxal 5'-phosphate synthase glutaminase subunit PdxT n=1 Tax=Pseudarthrobacter naphthalenicus TaxID=3031328 RepID=UPI0023B0F533|nr:pyridoxal 5'-phosphate synthase glutaminase subunit PdxT [Pseudarthrobacter sp. H3Y2-7]MDE8668882.1 pyridoxal 5'-phosphate synthase glutaminase subunit PdxT [Pseudarthrobacter sp. H3Y2-7]
MTNPPFAADPRLGAGLRIGVLALQGDFREHLRAVEASGAAGVGVRRPKELDGLDGLIIPGGESTAIDKLARAFDLAEPLKDCIRAGLPVYGSCAGMILLADDIADPATDLAGSPQQTFGGLDITVRRNAFGRQRESFETDLDFKGLDFSATESGVAPVHAVFIRGPWVERVGAGVEVLAQVEPADLEHASHAAGLPGTARIVAVRSGHLLATSFHPEVTGEKRVHELFIRMIRGDA